MSPFEAWIRAAQEYCEAVDTGADPTLRVALNSRMVSAYHEYKCSPDWKPNEIIQGPFEDRLDVTP